MEAIQQQMDVAKKMSVKMYSKNKVTFAMSLVLLPVFLNRSLVKVRKIK